jgi:transposase
LPPALKQRLVREWEHVVFLKEKILQLEAERRRMLKESEDVVLEKVRRLVTLRGIGPTGAWILVREFFGWRQFRNRRQLGSLAGLTPTPYQSGVSGREQGISKAGNRHVRGLAIELAWIWLRRQPNSRLARWYTERFGAAGGRARRVGIVAVARRLLIDLWRFLDGGVVPEGAEFKA